MEPFIYTGGAGILHTGLTDQLIGAPLAWEAGGGV